MVMQWTVNPPPLARLVRSQDTPPNNALVVYLVRTLDFQSGKAGSNPVECTSFNSGKPEQGAWA